MKKKIALGIMGVFIAFVLIIAGMILVPSLFSSKTTYSESTVLSVISGDVQIREADGNEWKDAKDEMKLAAGDTIRTGADSYALITFFEGSTMNIEPNSQIQVQAIEQAEGSDSTIVRLKQMAGETWNRVEKLVDSISKFEIETPAGTGSAKGTTIGMVIGPDGETTMRVYEGEGSLFSQGPVIIGEGMQSSSQQGQSPSAASPIPMPESVLRITMSPSAWANTVDPIGRSAGMVPPGIVVNQIPGAVTSGYGIQPQFIEIPNPEDGTYAIVIYGKNTGTINLSVEGLVRNGNNYSSIFSQKRTQETDEGDKWLIDLQAKTTNGVLDEITLSPEIEPLKGDEPGTVIITQGAFDGSILALADSYDAKYDAFKAQVNTAPSGDEIILHFTEDEVAGRLIKWATDEDIPVDLFNIEVELNSSGIAEASGDFEYSVFTGNVKVKGGVEIADKKPRIVISSIDIDLGALPIPVNALKNHINEEAEDATWSLPCDLISVDMSDTDIRLTVIRH